MLLNISVTGDPAMKEWRMSSTLLNNLSPTTENRIRDTWTDASNRDCPGQIEMYGNEQKFESSSTHHPVEEKSMKLHMMTHGDPHQYEEDNEGNIQHYQGSPYYQINAISSEYQGQHEYTNKYYDSTRNTMTGNPFVSSAINTSTTFSECDSSSMSNDDLLLSVAEEQLRPLIKEELRYTIQSKRLAKGLPSHVEIEYKVSEPEPETPTTVFKRQRRRERNKLAAAKCRFKKKMLSDKLMEESYDLENQNQKLKTEVQKLQEERQKLMYILNLHRPTCIVRSPSTSSPPLDMSCSSQITSSSPTFGNSRDYVEPCPSSLRKYSQSPFNENSHCSQASAFTYPPYSQGNKPLDQGPIQRSVIVQSGSVQSSSQQL